jgi:hypothetical protein
MDKTNLSLLLSAVGLAVSLGAGLVAALVLGAFCAGLLLGSSGRPEP